MIIEQSHVHHSYTFFMMKDLMLKQFYIHLHNGTFLLSGKETKTAPKLRIET